tara:strand:+ start:42 stop:383 length:342 start_codon:yes stop_codon:yes gene_type:complete
MDKVYLGKYLLQMVVILFSAGAMDGPAGRVLHLGGNMVVVPEKVMRSLKTFLQVGVRRVRTTVEGLVGHVKVDGHRHLTIYHQEGGVPVGTVVRGVKGLVLSGLASVGTQNIL